MIRQDWQIYGPVEILRSQMDLIAKGATGSYRKNWLTRIGYILIGGSFLLWNGVAFLAIPVTVLVILYYVTSPVLLQKPFDSRTVAIGMGFLGILLIMVLFALVGWKMVEQAIRSKKT